MKQNLTILFFLLLFVHQSLGQISKKDSLQSLIDSSIVQEDILNWKIELLKIEEDTAVFNCQVKDFVGSIPSGNQVQSVALYNLANVFYKKRNYKEGLVFAENAITLFEELNDEKSLANSFLLKGSFEDKMSKYDKAILSIQKAVSFYYSVENYKKQVDCLNKMGIIHKKIGNFTEALLLYHHAYEICVNEGIEDRKGATCINIGVVLKKEKKYEDALEYYFKAEEIYSKQANNFSGLANVYNNIGNVYRLQGRHHNALSYYHLAIQNRLSAGQEKRLSYTYNNIALVYMDMGNSSKSLEYLLKSEDLKKQYNNEESLSSTYLNICELYLINKEYKEFNFYWKKSRSLALKYQQNDIRRNLLVLKSRYESEVGNYKAAYIYLSSVYEELDTLDMQSQKMLNSVLQAQFDDQQNKNEIHELSDAILLLDQQKEEIEKKKDALMYSVIILAVLSMFFIILVVLLVKKQRILKEKTIELAVTNEQLKASTVSIEEKELLLKEIHHRVKNNLQIIQSLIRLQNSEEKECLNSDMLTDFELRVSSMALVHESLYKNGDLATINVKEYFDDLTDNLVGVYQLEHDVEIDKNIKVDELDIDTLVPLGLLSTEIISNSLKYGVASLKNGKITVFLSSLENKWYELIIHDNGSGFDMSEKMDKNTLGIELIYTLVEQLDGELEFSNDNGASYRIKFKAQAKK